MERLTKEEAFQLHYEFENIDDSLMETYGVEEGSYVSETNHREARLTGASGVWE